MPSHVPNLGCLNRPSAIDRFWILYVTAASLISGGPTFSIIQEAYWGTNEALLIFTTR